MQYFLSNFLQRKRMSHEMSKNSCTAGSNYIKLFCLFVPLHFSFNAPRCCMVSMVSMVRSFLGLLNNKHNHNNNKLHFFKNTILCSKLKLVNVLNSFTEYIHFTIIIYILLLLTIIYFYSMYIMCLS